MLSSFEASRNKKSVAVNMGRKPRYQEVDGMLFPVTFSPDLIRAASNFEAEKGDVVVITYPKCGTTWMQQIVFLILNNGNPPGSAAEYFNSLPFLEMTPADSLKWMTDSGGPAWRCIKTHLPFTRLKLTEEGKYIYVARNPEDCVVSFYHHTRFFPIYFFSDGEFDDYFEQFVKGDVDWSDYFDHLLSWFDVRHRENVLFMTFESIKADVRGAVLKIAQFLGDRYHQNLIENEEIMDKVLRHSSLDFMRATVNEYWKQEFSQVPSREIQLKSTVMANYAKILEEAFNDGHKAVGDFVRAGNVGQGKITLSKEQMDKLKQRTREKTADCDVMNFLQAR